LQSQICTKPKSNFISFSVKTFAPIESCRLEHPEYYSFAQGLVLWQINGLQNCDWRLQDAFIWRFQDATFSVQVFYATLTFTTVTVVLVLPWIMPMKTREMYSKWNLYMSASVPAEVHNMIMWKSIWTRKEVNEKLKSLSAPIVGLILQRSRIVTDNDGHYASSTTYLYPLTDGDTRQGLNNLQATMDSSLVTK
jgi:hypothetical protein